jgi:hypothetical protein
MLKLTLWQNKDAIGKTFDLLANNELSLFHKDGVVVVFVVMQYLPQSLLDWIHENNIKIMSWFGYPEMRLLIPLSLIDTIASYHGEIPMYVPTKD